MQTTANRPPTEPTLTNRINVFVDDETAYRIREIARRKGIKPGQATRYLIGKGIDFWDGLTHIERETS